MTTASSAPGVSGILPTDVTDHEIVKADARDAHETRAAQETLDARLRAVLLQIPAAIFIVDAPDGRIAFKSRLVDELLGNPDHDLAKAKASLRGWAVHKDGSPYEL